MKRLIREALPNIAAGLVVATILAAIGIVGDFAGFRNSAHDTVLRYAISGCLFVILLAGALFVVVSKRPNVLEPTHKHYRFGTRQRLLATVAALLAIGVMTWFIWPVNLPRVTLAVENRTGVDLAISKLSKFSIDLYTPLEDDQRLATGEASLVTVSGPDEVASEINVPAHASVVAYANILNESRYRRFVGSDSVYISFVLCDKDESPKWYAENRIRFSMRALRSVSVRVPLKYP